MLTIGRREDSTTFDPIKTAQNIDFWVFSNVYDVLIRVDKTGTKLEPGLAESWTVSPTTGSPIRFKHARREVLRRLADHRRGRGLHPHCASATTRARSGPTATR